MSFRHVWLPNIACTVGGIAIGWALNSYYAHQSDVTAQAQKQREDTMLIALENAGYVQLARNAKGEITGGRIIHLQGGAASESFATGTLTDAPSKPPAASKSHP